MRRSAWIFLAVILLPSLVLAWMAVRSARDQQVILEHQQAVICQNITDGLAKSVQDQVDNSRSAFVDAVDQLLQSSRSPQILAGNFNQKLQNGWKLAEVGFAVDVRGTIYSPQPYEGGLARTFRNENDRFLSNQENAEVFAQNASKPPAKIVVMQQALDVYANQSPSQSPAQQAGPSQNQQQSQTPPQQNPAFQNSLPNQSNNNSVPSQGQSPFAGNTSNQNNTTNVIRPQSLNQLPQIQQPNPRKNQETLPNSTQQGQAANAAVQQQAMSQSDSQAGQNTFEKKPPKAKKAEPMQRQVEPQSEFGQTAVSNTLPEESDFRRVIGSQGSGAPARFLEDKLRLMVWYRPRNGPLVFGSQISQPSLIENIQPLLRSSDVQKGAPSTSSDPDYILAILDDRGRPVAVSREGARLDYKHPFVATEIGEALPHWEAALYLLDVRQIKRSASTLQLTLGSIVAVLVAAILLGGWLMAADVRRQMRLAQQKTDFVSNVSHELKTPLTSIRMFADMLAEGRVDEHDRQSNYLRIISAESARLTRLINNVLDFARMERGAPGGERRPCDLVQVVREAVDTCQPHFETVGVTVSQEIRTDSLPVTADRDALAQIILNLLSNAEKYGGNEILVRVRREETAGRATGCVDVMDRGPGIPAKKQEIIFQPFQRLNDSLASGVTGSGLGLTLARRIAQAHGGNVTYSPREGGGSCFTLALPLTAPEAENKSASSGNAS